MPTVRQHLAKAHEAMAAHHQEMSRCHTAAMTKTTDHEQEFHKGAAAAHDAAAESHLAMCDACAKAVDGDLAKLQPMPFGISLVTPTPLGVTAVPRAGQKPVAKAQVDEEFVHLTRVETGEE